MGLKQIQKTLSCNQVVTTLNYHILYLFPSQSHDVFETFADNLKLHLKNIANKSPYLIIVLGESNVESSNWQKHDKTRYQNSEINVSTSQFAYANYFRNQPIHILTDLSFLLIQYLSGQPIHSSLKFSFYLKILSQIIFFMKQLLVTRGTQLGLTTRLYSQFKG